MKVIFIAGPFRAKNPWEVECNIRRAEEWAFRVAECGAMPLCPHTNTRFFDKTLTDDFWLEGTSELLKRCDAIFLTPNWEKSKGSVAEKKLAEKNNIHVFYTLDELKNWI